MYGVTRVYLPLFGTLAEPPVHLSSCQQTQLQGHTLLKPAIPEVSLPPPPFRHMHVLVGSPWWAPGLRRNSCMMPPPPVCSPWPQECCQQRGMQLSLQVPPVAAQR